MPLVVAGRASWLATTASPADSPYAEPQAAGYPARVGYRRLPYDGGVVEYVVDGPDDAPELLIFHVGTPCAAVPHDALARAAAAMGIRTAIYSRGGYAGSTRRPGRTVADEAPITAALADRLGYRRFFVAGFSGGGPVALACAARLPDRVRACISIGGLAPWAEVGDEFLEWVDDPADWKQLRRGDEPTLIPDFEPAAATFSRMTMRGLIARFGALPPDRAALVASDGIGEPLLRSMRRANSRSFWGWLDDNVAEARDWGFRVGDIRVPVVLRHGARDQPVDFRQAEWLAKAMPRARTVFLPEAGHIAITYPFAAWIHSLVEAAA